MDGITSLYVATIKAYWMFSQVLLSMEEGALAAKHDRQESSHEKIVVCPYVCTYVCTYVRTCIHMFVCV